MMDTNDRDDDRIARALRELDADATLDDLRFERLARRVSAAGAARLGAIHARRDSRAARALRAARAIAIAAGLAAAALIAFDLGAARDAGQLGLAARAAGLHAPSTDSLFAASVGAVPEDEFLTGLWGPMDAEAMFAASTRP